MLGNKETRGSETVSIPYDLLCRISGEVRPLDKVVGNKEGLSDVWEVHFFFLFRSQIASYYREYNVICRNTEA